MTDSSWEMQQPGNEGLALETTKWANLFFSFFFKMDVEHCTVKVCLIQSNCTSGSGSPHAVLSAMPSKKNTQASDWPSEAQMFFLPERMKTLTLQRDFYVCSWQNLAWRGGNSPSKTNTQQMKHQQQPDVPNCCHWLLWPLQVNQTAVPICRSAATLLQRHKHTGNQRVKIKELFKLPHACWKDTNRSLLLVIVEQKLQRCSIPQQCASINTPHISSSNDKAVRMQNIFPPLKFASFLRFTPS